MRASSPSARSPTAGAASFSTDWLEDAPSGVSCRSSRAFSTGGCAASPRRKRPGRWEDVCVSGRSDRAVVRSLRGTAEQRQLLLREADAADQQADRWLDATVVS